MIIRKQGNSTGTERERKFLVKTLPTGRSRYAHTLIEQGYLATTGRGHALAEVRIRRMDGRAVLTVKKGHGTARLESEIALDRASARVLWPLTRGESPSHQGPVRDPISRSYDRAGCVSRSGPRPGCG